MGPGTAIAAILVSLALIVGSVVAVIAKAGQMNITLIGFGILGVVMGTLVAEMIKVNSPGHTQVIQLFGRYLGTNRRTGLSLVPPLTNAKKVSVRVRNFETNEIKVNDLNGNPVVIGADCGVAGSRHRQSHFCRGRHEGVHLLPSPNPRCGTWPPHTPTTPPTLTLFPA